MLARPVVGVPSRPVRPKRGDPSEPESTFGSPPNFGVLLNATGVSSRDLPRTGALTLKKRIVVSRRYPLACPQSVVASRACGTGGTVRAKPADGTIVASAAQKAKSAPTSFTAKARSNGAEPRSSSLAIVPRGAGTQRSAVRWGGSRRRRWRRRAADSSRSIEAATSAAARAHTESYSNRGCNQKPAILSHIKLHDARLSLLGSGRRRAIGDKKGVIS